MIDWHGYRVHDDVLADNLREPLKQVFAELLGDRPGSRDALSHPVVTELARSPGVRQVVEPVLGEQAFAFRATLFDKHDDVNWPVPWHQDRFVPVKEQHDVEGFDNWSQKDAVWHVEPNVKILSRLLAVRVDVDGSDEANGGLTVLPTTHELGILPAERIAELVEAGEPVCPKVVTGGALAMRPLLLHSSKRTVTTGHRRIVHLEFSAEPLPKPLEFAAGVLVASE